MKLKLKLKLKEFLHDEEKYNEQLKKVCKKGTVPIGRTIDLIFFN